MNCLLNVYTNKDHSSPGACSICITLFERVIMLRGEHFSPTRWLLYRKGFKE